MHLNIADWVILAITAASAIFGLFGGFSGALGFVAGLASSGVVAKFSYPLLGGYFASTWMVALATFVLSILVFAVARIIVRKVVNGLLSQPADAIFGSLVAALAGAALSLAATYALKTFTDVQVESVLLTQIFQFTH